MPARCRHPRIVAGVCRVYALAIWCYPPSLRRAFHRELTVTFRNRAEDVLNAGVVPAFLFALHLATDWLRSFTFGTDYQPTLSLLGLSVDDEACGSIDRTTFSVSLMLATLGVILLVSGWYGWLSMYADIVHQHRAF
jgi:hypothetical protein